MDAAQLFMSAVNQSKEQDPLFASVLDATIAATDIAVSKILGSERTTQAVNARMIIFMVLERYGYTPNHIASLLRRKPHAISHYGDVCKQLDANAPLREQANVIYSKRYIPTAHFVAHPDMLRPKPQHQWSTVAEVDNSSLHTYLEIVPAINIPPLPASELSSSHHLPPMPSALRQPLPTAHLPSKKEAWIRQEGVADVTVSMLMDNPQLTKPVKLALAAYVKASLYGQHAKSELVFRGYSILCVNKAARQILLSILNSDVQTSARLIMIRQMSKAGVK